MINNARLHSLKRFLRHLERLGQSKPMNLAEQLWHAHRLRRTLAALAKIEREPVRAWRNSGQSAPAREAIENNSAIG